MFSQDLKLEIAKKVQEILKETNHLELPTGETVFLLHIDGAEAWSWANIRNNSNRYGQDVPVSLIRNTSAHSQPPDADG